MTTTEKKNGKGAAIGFWIFSIVLLIGMLFSSLPGILGQEQSTKFMTLLGYPAYIIPFISWAKLLGAIMILLPGFPRLKEWAYAGITFDLLGATYSQIEFAKTATGPMHDNLAFSLLFMAIFFIVLFGSYIFYHKKLKAQQNIN